MSRTILIAACALLGLLAACNDNPLASFQPEISSAPNNYQFQATHVSNVTTTATYNWQNSGTTANVNQACAITHGSATVTILDAGGVEVYSKNLAENGTFATAAGTTGTWVIRVRLTNVSGTLNFRVQKP